MKKNYDAVIARTHTAEYSMHKYWARKPHNVLASFIKNIVPDNGIVLDPFCGSGVALHEARKQGMQAYGFDINPIAGLITSVLIHPPETNAFAEEMEHLLSILEKEIEPFYSVDGRRIKYAVHETIVRCKCKRRVPFRESDVKGRSKKCPKCREELHFNLENLIDTRIERIYFENEKTPCELEEVLSSQKALSEQECFENSQTYNYPFTLNRRILAFDGMQTSSLFTKRNFSILSHIADQFYRISDSGIRNAALLLLTASVAQCSRLIPNRNDLSTGGPAWSVPGFWVPAEHLETNPIVHIRARYDKFLKAIQSINSGNYPEIASVKKTDGIQGMREFRNTGKRADLIFFDPPYGDSVPYLEFSAMWNSFLKDVPEPETDISVSDRMPKNEAWNHYNENLSEILKEISKTLAENGRLLITFNNNDMKAWEALINGLQKNQLVCEYVTYQIPAVISSKAQFSPEGSYISDIYSVYRYDKDAEPSSDLSVITNALTKAAKARNGVIACNLANRVAILEWLRNNIKVELLEEKDVIIKSLFEKKENRLTFKGTIEENHFKIEEHARMAAKNILKDGPCEWNELYKNIAIQYADYGFLDSNELKTYLNGHVLFDKKRCISYID